MLCRKTHISSTSLKNGFVCVCCTVVSIEAFQIGLLLFELFCSFKFNIFVIWLEIDHRCWAHISIAWIWDPSAWIGKFQSLIATNRTIISLIEDQLLKLKDYKQQTRYLSLVINSYFCYSIRLKYVCVGQNEQILFFELKVLVYC